MQVLCKWKGLIHRTVCMAVVILCEQFDLKLGCKYCSNSQEHQLGERMRLVRGTHSVLRQTLTEQLLDVGPACT